MHTRAEMYRELVEEHQAWLSSLGEQLALKLWTDAINDNRDGPIFEALVRRWLQKQGALVWPNEQSATRRRAPDFRCARNGCEFFVECTCVDDDRATTRTCLSSLPPSEGGAREYHKLDREVLDSCMRKVAQAKMVTHAPMLVAVGSLHPLASLMSSGDLETQRMATVFPVRNPAISAVLLFPSASEPTYGILNPAATHPFGRAIFPGVVFYDQPR